MSINDLNIRQKRMAKLLACLAILTSKFVSFLIRLLGLGMASNLPGKIAKKIYPDILPFLFKRLVNQCLVVTGTNGKSTTSGLLASILKEAGYKVIHNREGANMLPGIIAALLQAVHLGGNDKNNFALLEVDEAALPHLAKAIECKNILVTNLYRDQLDRYGELDRTATLIAQGIKEKNSQVILNADDPNVCNLPVPDGKTFYGLDVLSDNANNEISYCPKCGNEIVYNVNNVWRCSHCEYKRPEPYVIASQIESIANSSKFTITAKDKATRIDLTLPGVFNIYNATAASAAALTLGIKLDTIKAGLEKYQTLFGRSEQIVAKGRNVIIQLIKNPAGASRSLATLANSKCEKALIIINDNFADGRDVSWLWDANFEVLADVQTSFMVSGNRAQDMAVRLKYAGVPREMITCIPSLNEAFNTAIDQLQLNETLWVLPTYTALLEIQNIIKPFKKET